MTDAGVIRRSGMPLWTREEQRFGAHRRPALAGSVAADQLVRADAEHRAGARHERLRVDEMQPVADERRDQHAAAVGQVRADRFEMVDELRKQVVRERAEAGEDDLVRSQRWRRLVVAVRTAGAGDGDVGIASCGLAEGVLQELADLLVHRTNVLHCAVGANPSYTVRYR